MELNSDFVNKKKHRPYSPHPFLFPLAPLQPPPTVRRWRQVEDKCVLISVTISVTWRTLSINNALRRHNVCLSPGQINYNTKGVNISTGLLLPVAPHKLTRRKIVLIKVKLRRFTGFYQAEYFPQKLCSKLPVCQFLICSQGLLDCSRVVCVVTTEITIDISAGLESLDSLAPSLPPSADVL